MFDLADFRIRAAAHLGLDVRTLDARPDPRVEALAAHLARCDRAWPALPNVGALPPGAAK